MSAGVDLVRAGPEHRAALSRLLQLYVHDFSEILGELPRDDGSFEIEPPDRYWSDARRHAFLIRTGGRLAGFALLCQQSRIDGDLRVMDVAEFFVVRGARRKRVGQTVAHRLFEMFPGTWEVRVMTANERAIRFWRACVGAFADAACNESEWSAPSGRRFLVLRFQNG
jgi:predicted acetyltransferase